MPNRFDAQTIASISGIGRQFSDATILMHEAIARQVGLSGTDHKYLGLIIQHGEMTAGELSKLTGLTTGAITGLVDRLERKQLVKREYDAEDRRKVLILPDTEKAHQLLGGVFAEIQSKTLALLSSFDDREIAVIGKYLTSATAMMKETTDQLNAKNHQPE